MRVRYIGQFDAVAIPAARIEAKRGEAVEVSDELAQGLLLQGAPHDAAGQPCGPGTEWEPVQSPARGKRDPEGQ